MSEIRKHFVAPEGKTIVEFDYAQLEVRVLAALSEDHQLTEDLVNGLDMHCMSAALLYGNTYDIIKRACDAGDTTWLRCRKYAKSVSFLIQYGGGARTASEQAGVAEHLIKKYMKRYADRYPRAAQFSEEVKVSVRASRTSSKRKTAKGVPAGVGYWKAPTGRLFGFVEQDSPSWVETSTSFSPTQIKNYPSQGTGWDIVAVMLAHLMDLCYNRFPGVDFVNTVHDSLMFYVPDEEVDDFVRLGEKELAAVPLIALKLWDWEINVDFPVDTKIGKDWLNMKSYESN